MAARKKALFALPVVLLDGSARQGLFCKQPSSAALNDLSLLSGLLISRRDSYFSLPLPRNRKASRVLPVSDQIFMSCTHPPLALGLSARVVTMSSLLWEQLVELYKKGLFEEVSSRPSPLCLTSAVSGGSDRLGCD